MVGIDGTATVDAESSLEPSKGMDIGISLTKSELAVKLDGEMVEDASSSVQAASTNVLTSQPGIMKDGLRVLNNNDLHAQDTKPRLESDPLSGAPQLSGASSPEDDSTQSSRGPWKDLGRFSDSHDTPSGSMTSASLVSPRLMGKSVTPSAQLNQALNTPLSTSADASTSAPPFSRKRKQQSYVYTSSQVRPKSSIPSRLPSSVYAQQCVSAAFASRLNPYALHKDEQELLQEHLCHLHVTTYLNIRNGILRLWTRNPMLAVTEEEALGCAKDLRWMNLAAFAYNWLVRNGYINFGCVDVPRNPIPPGRGRKKERPTIVIIGAGMAGLGCARQLKGLFEHYDNKTIAPKVIILEGRKRIGGRIYSHPLMSLKSDTLPPGLRPTAEMGAQIIVGFDHGNPLDPIIRAQLALRYHLLRDISTIYDTDGNPVDGVQDSLVEKLYNDLLNRSGVFRHKAVINKTAEGDRELINSGRDSFFDDGLTIRQYEDAAASGTVDMMFPAKRLRRGVGHRTGDFKPVTNPQLPSLDQDTDISAARSCQAMGWRLREGVSDTATLYLDGVARDVKTHTLGAVMDEAIHQCQRILPLTPRDMRLLNWHYANLEYANAANLGKLSLSGWDQDMGNEFDGEHAEVVGGYQQVPRGLWSYPSKIDVRTRKVVTKISYKTNDGSTGKAKVHLDDGEVIAADKVVLTTPLGVLKSGSIAFSPPLPEWKTNAIDRLGFGVMNKVILVFEKPFWDVERDMIGLLREPAVPDSLFQADYAPGRGKFYLFWNCMKISGLPMLIALMAGDSAHEAERLPDSEILSEVVSQLRNIYKDTIVPDPLESIITRWGQDEFARGSYSYVAARALPGDYDLMAKPLGNLYFAGEATCGTHPATVHGAYLSGLRAAKEVLESIIGPLEFSSPLVPSKSKTSSATTSSPAPIPLTSTPSKKRKEPSSDNFAPSNGPGEAGVVPTSQPKWSFEPFYKERYESAMWEAIFAEIGHSEPRPRKQPLNPFLLYQKDYWFVCKAQCDEARRQSTGNANAKAPRDEVRQALGQMWRDAPEHIRKPYLDQIDINRKTNAEDLSKWKERIAEWEKRTYEVKDAWCAANPYEIFTEELRIRVEGGESRSKLRKVG